MIDHSAVIARIDGLKLFRKVGGAADAAAVISGNTPIGDGPAAFVLPMSDHPAPPASQDLVLQAMTVTFGVAVMVRKAADASGAGRLDPLKSLSDGLRAGLVGWSAGDGWGPCYLGGARLLEFGAGALWWLEEFAAEVGIAGLAGL